ncbi:hypothetical protein ACR820_05060 [Streptomyces netropsis]
MKSNSGRASWAVVGMLNLVSFTIGMESYAINLAAPTLIDSLSLGLTTLMWVINRKRSIPIQCRGRPPDPPDEP